MGKVLRTFLNTKQLPPINESKNNHVLDNPHVRLTEIMRQAQESEIVRLATWIREGNSLSDYSCDNQDVQIIKKKDMVTGMYSWADQILCATNKTKDYINSTMRSINGFGTAPQENDKIICLHNYWDFFDSTNENPLTNGTVGKLKYYYTQKIYFPDYIINHSIEYMFAEIESEDGYTYSGVPIEFKKLKDGKSDIDGKIAYKMNKNKKTMDAPFDFDYGYAITVHKAQGSEYNKVLLFEEGFPYDKEEHSRWLYTGITRAVDKLVIIEK